MGEAYLWIVAFCPFIFHKVKPSLVGKLSLSFLNLGKFVLSHTQTLPGYTSPSLDRIKCSYLEAQMLKKLV
nr:hypothetical protein CFP56_12470 [Quercus suber]